jgi:type I restriction enzyme S subunit
VFSSINKNELGAVGFIAPTENLLATFEEKVTSLDQRVEVNSKEIVTLEEIRDSLLPKLLSGELDISTDA